MIYTNKQYIRAIFGAFLVFTLLSAVTFIPTAAEAQLNCQSEIYLQAKNTPEDKFKKGYCFIKLGQFQEGVTRLKGVENEIPLVGDYVIYYQAAGYENMGDLNTAASLFNKILTQYPTSGLKKKVLARVGNIYTQTGDYQNAERIYKSLYVEESDRSLKASYLYGLGEALEKQGKFSEAMSNYKMTWVEYPETQSSSKAYAAAQNLSKVSDVPFSVSETDYLQRADTLFSRSRWSEALQSYRKVSSKSTQTLTNMGIAMANTKMYREADSLLSGIKSPEAIYWRAKIMAKQGLDNRASDTYSQIYLLYPSSPYAADGLYNAARLYQINDQTDKAIKTYDILIRTYPNSEFAEDGALYLGWIYYRKGMFREAHTTFSGFTNSKSSYNASSAKYWKARTLEKQGQTAEAQSIYKELAMQSTPTYHTYMAQKKTGLSPSYAKADPESTALSPGAGERKNKADMLIRLGMPDDAELEIGKMEDEATTKEDFVAVSLMYSKVDDYYNSIRVAQDLGLPQANTLSYPQGYRDIVAPYAKKFGVDEYLVYSIIREESRFQKDARSPANAVGLMQLIPPTAKTVARQIGINGFTVEMLTIPRVNIEMGIFYFKQVLDKFQGDVELALASYNAGPGRAADWKVRFYGLDKDEFIEEVPFRETRNYIRRILRSYGAYKAIYGDTAQAAPVTPGTNHDKKYPVN